MEQHKIDMYIMTNQKYFPEEKIVFLKEKLKTLDDEKFSLIQTISFKDPTIILILSITLGYIGVDRFMLGDTGMGVLKLLTFGVFGIMWFIDIFTISKKVKEKNFNTLMTLL